MTTLPAVVRIVDLPTATTITGAEMLEVVQTGVGGTAISVQIPLTSIMTTTLGGLPTGGGTSQILAKSSGTNFASAWYDVTSFVSVNTASALVTSGTGTALVIGIPAAGIGSTQLGPLAVQSSNVTSNAIGNAQFRQGSPLSVVGVAGSATANVADITASGALQVLQVNAGGTGLAFTTIAQSSAFLGITNTGLFAQSGTVLATGTFGIVGTTLVTGLFGVVGTSQFTGALNILGTALVTGAFGQVGTSLMTGLFGVSGTAAFTGVFGVVGTTLFTSGAFGIVGTTTLTGSFAQVGTSLMTGVFNVVGTATFTGIHSVNGTTLFTSGAFGIVGTTLVTGAFSVVGTTIITGTLNVSNTANFAAPVIFGAAATTRVNLSAFGTIRTQIFTASGTYTPNANMIFCIAECVGGGGGGGGAVSTTSNSCDGGGGGSGGYSFAVFTTGSIGASMAVTIGAAGVGAATGTSNGGSGGTTSLGTILVARGGAGGTFGQNLTQQGAGGAGGTTTGAVGDFLVPGSPGGCGWYASGFSSLGAPTGFGAPSYFGGGAVATGLVTNADFGNGITGIGYGAGGSGGFSKNTTTGTGLGGTGVAGVLRIIEYCTQ